MLMILAFVQPRFSAHNPSHLGTERTPDFDRFLGCPTVISRFIDWATSASCSSFSSPSLIAKQPEPNLEPWLVDRVKKVLNRP